MAAKPIRIAHLQLLPLLSGVQRVTLEELTRLNRSLFEPFVICKEPGPLTEALEKAGIPFFCVPELVREISPLADLRALMRLKRLFREQKFDILHTHSSKTGILGRLAGRLAGVPLVMHTVHGYAFPAARNTFQKLFYFLMEWIGARLTDALVVLNQNDFEIAAKRLGVPLDKLHLIPNGVDPERYSPPSLEVRNKIRLERFGIGKDGVAIGMVGRLWRQKNPECFVKAGIELLKNNPLSIHFFLIGDGEEREKLEGLIKASGNQQAIHILGWRDDADRLLDGLDIFVLPSLWEGMPLAILEAMASSLQVVASNIPGNRDLVEDAENGYLFELNNEKVLVEKLRKLINDPALRNRLGESGRKKVQANYTLNERVKTMESLYLGSPANNKKHHPNL